MNIEDYSTEDFACDHSFQQYCREEDESSIAFWTEWINQHPEKSDLISEAKQLVGFLSAGQGSRLEQLSYLERGLEQRKLLEADLRSTQLVRQIPRRSVTYLTIFAACFAFAVLGYFLYSDNLLLNPHPDSRHTAYSSTEVNRKTVVLPDGSMVTLNTNSSITLSPLFSKTKRELTLTGEGFFEVKHDAEHPFFVYTDEVTVKVLGTTFNINAYPQAKNGTETVLLKGKVEVTVKAEPSQKYILKPNQKFITKRNGNPEAAPEISLESTVVPAEHLNSGPRETAWLRNRLELNNERLEDITHRLEKWYGIEIGFEDDQPKSYRYSGTFESETLLRALEALQLSYPFKVTYKSQKVIISK
jgi:ferric-dicitrate binding protein FerR (iron transport regulator)